MFCPHEHAGQSYLSLAEEEQNNYFVHLRSFEKQQNTEKHLVCFPEMLCQTICSVICSDGLLQPGWWQMEWESECICVGSERLLLDRVSWTFRLESCSDKWMGSGLWSSSSHDTIVFLTVVLHCLRWQTVTSKVFPTLQHLSSHNTSMYLFQHRSAPKFCTERCAWCVGVSPQARGGLEPPEEAAWWVCSFESLFDPLKNQMSTMSSSKTVLTHQVHQQLQQLRKILSCCHESGNEQNSGVFCPKLERPHKMTAAQSWLALFTRSKHQNYCLNTCFFIGIKISWETF